MKHESPSRQVHSAVSDGWVQGGSFFASIISGTLLGYFGDKWLGTEPWLVVIGIVIGSYAGFARMWKYLKEMDERPPRDR